MSTEQTTASQRGLDAMIILTSAIRLIIRGVVLDRVQTFVSSAIFIHAQ